MRYKNVQGLRAIAASIVIIVHSTLVMSVPSSFVTLGQSGVDIFFVISGFIICQTAARPHTGALRFLARRWWRIFPLYWIVLAFSVSINAFGMVAPWNPPQHPALDYIFLLTTENRFLLPAWTLVFELYFYVSLAFVILISPPGRFYRTLGIWIGAQFILIMLRGPEGGPPLNAVSIEFYLGCFIAWLNAQNLIRRELMALALAFLLFAAGEWWFVYVVPINSSSSVIRLVTFGAGGALCLYSLVGLESRGILMFPKFFTRLGDASYSLYLWHFPLLVVAMTLGISGVVAIPLIVMIAFASYFLIEAPLFRVNAGTVARFIRAISTSAFAHGGSIRLPIAIWPVTPGAPRQKSLASQRLGPLNADQSA